MSVTSASSDKIVSCLWYNNTAKEAADFYIELFNTSPQASTFPKSLIVSTNYQGDAPVTSHERESRKVFNVVFTLAGHRFMAMNGQSLLLT